LQLLLPKKVTVVGVQKRVLSPWQNKIVRHLNLSNVFVLSSAMAEPLQQLGINTNTLNVGIDIDRYKPQNNKATLRDKYNIPREKQIVLHVGHIKESRNIGWLLDVQNALTEVQVVLVGSTTTKQDVNLCNQLEDAGVIVLREYFREVQELYQLADIYCFTVMKDDGAMETPLSILESMATNLPVITTRFGRLPEQFHEDDYYRYVSSAADIIKILKSGFKNKCNNREKMYQYTWQSTTERLLCV
jgi:glycosyltransferase involved in cell wall biosynthesis